MIVALVIGLSIAASFAAGYALGWAGAVNDLKARLRCFNPEHPRENYTQIFRAPHFSGSRRKP